MEVRLRNFTGHPLTLTQSEVGKPDKSIRLKSEGRARIDSSIQEGGSLQFEGLDIPLLELQERNIIGLPEPEEGVVYIVSGIVATAAQRHDVVAPSRINREEKTGRVKEAKALILPSPMRR